MTITNTHLRIALFVLLGILIGWGVLKLAFGISFGPLVDQVLPNGVMIGAVAIFAWNRWIWDQEKKAQEKALDAEKRDQETPPV